MKRIAVLQSTQYEEEFSGMLDSCGYLCVPPFRAIRSV